MAKVWMAVVEGKQHGPLSNSELKSLADCKRLQPTDLIWKEGMAEWVPASKIKGLFPAAPPPLPASPVADKSPDVASAAKNLFGAFAGAAKRAGSRVREAAEKAAEQPIAAAVDERPSSIATPPKLSRRTWIFASVGGGALLLSCVVCGAIGSLVGPSPVNKPLTPEEQKHVEKFGPKPTRSSFDGSVEEVKAYLAKNLNDPNSVEYVEWYPVVVMKDDGWRVIVKYRAKNGFGGVVTKEQRFTIQNGEVVDTSE